MLRKNTACKLQYTVKGTSNFFVLRRVIVADKIGVWIDHRKAIMVSFRDGVEVVHEIESEVEKHVRDAEYSQPEA